MDLPTDIVEIVLSKLPIDLRVKLRVPPGKARLAADCVKRLVERKALICGDPHHFHAAPIQLTWQDGLVPGFVYRRKYPYRTDDYEDGTRRTGCGWCYHGLCGHPDLGMLELTLKFAEDFSGVWVSDRAVVLQDPTRDFLKSLKRPA